MDRRAGERGVTGQLIIDDRETRLTRRRYDRIAPIYDALEWMMEWRARLWRRDLWSRVGTGRVLEMGVGTGKNIRYYPEGRDIVAMDISEKMLNHARRKAERFGSRVTLELGDAQALSYPDASFDVVAATFLFCSVPDPVLGLTEARRVLKPGGQLLLLEHVLSRRAGLRRIMQWIDPVPFHIWGAHIDRDTLDNVRRAGFVDVVDTSLSLDIVKRIEGRAPGHDPNDERGQRSFGRSG
jgi:phosphatidylethanolamine/phosphatidyl-N-methylethanolamine N-methyltransferase